MGRRIGNVRSVDALMRARVADGLVKIGVVEG